MIKQEVCVCGGGGGGVGGRNGGNSDLLLHSVCTVQPVYRLTWSDEQH